LKDSLFLDYAKNNLIILEADFPQRKKIASTLKVAYNDLADKYNPGGAFPRIVLLDTDGKLWGDLSYRQQPSATFIAEIKQQLNW
jgi:thiamine biosynthesis lipoprotein